MSKPIAYAATALHDGLAAYGVVMTRAAAERLARDTIDAFLSDAETEGRFDNAAITSLRADLT